MSRSPHAGAFAAARGEPGHLFGLRKTWVDPTPGIEMVQVHYAWTPPGQDPDWDDRRLPGADPQ